MICWKILKDFERLLEPEIIEIVIGRAEVRQIFFSKRKETILELKLQMARWRIRLKLEFEERGGCQAGRDRLSAKLMSKCMKSKKAMIAE